MEFFRNTKPYYRRRYNSKYGSACSQRFSGEKMTLTQLDAFLSSYLHIQDFPNDISLNGIQVQNSQPGTKQIKKAAFCVDACRDTINRSIQAHADLLFVHHGLFWGREQGLTGIHYERISQLIQNDLALYACHLPLDAHKEIGHNYSLARKIGLSELEPFGEWNRLFAEYLCYFLFMYLRMSRATALAMMMPLMICCQYGSTPIKVRP